MAAEKSPRVLWPLLLEEIRACQKCGLCQGRTQAVPGEGNVLSPLLFVGEGPGAREDATGRPFVGAAGQLLDRMLGAIGLVREQVYIANIVKCRPPGNRAPTPDEAAACLPYLRAQVALIRPQIIVCLGATPARYIMGEDTRVTRDRGKWLERKGVRLMCTFHPAALLRDESKKRPAWEDFQAIRDALHTLKLNTEEEP
ncbi:MAG: uracil-DNA glycosylase [Clostridia bacterium]|nr:uracil-DNA glycosylase [Clostridia bacterium]